MAAPAKTQEARRSGGDEQERPMRGDERRSVALLGIPTLALALATTIVTTYLPVVAQGSVGSTLVIGLIIGAEGLMALWLPLLVGSWSDRLRTPIESGGACRSCLPARR